MARLAVVLVLALAVAANAAGPAASSSATGATVKASTPGMVTASGAGLAAPAAAGAAGEAGATEKKGFSGMYFGILTSFVIAWTIYFFLIFFETGTTGDYYFYSYSYLTLFVLISLGLSKYFTSSILTGILVTFLFALIAGSAFAAMSTITSPTRFEGDKSNMGRTRLEAGHL
eukprot:CAMPEP_0173379486 /NCGR_PEP_ID=MMETSP1356-20130122/2413_1 /TAXON_ID=77927 ORGANISM="Hemiselmis virescens, Strain PCC157" /NCGR_SAMPLE_ID=MMETSP1356 /ASSEMBLY_ACC=CAM_ASM_000847 /LENGTH=172 /DNA_ID=CAMNT_0014332831 /DNA_START=11 /DNA_END=529 /DNA_ORIENTATION=-